MKKFNQGKESIVSDFPTFLKVNERNKQGQVDL